MNYALSTVWHIGAPLEHVWEAVYRLQHWPDWWRGALSVSELEKGDAQGVGGLYHFVWRGRLPYTLGFACRVTRVEPLVALEGIASGELEGAGLWRFFRDGANSIVHYEWRVRTNKCWMELVAPFAHPLFRWNHDVLMREGGLGLSRLLNARLIACASGG